MARCRLSDGWRCLFANDIGHKKSRAPPSQLGLDGESSVGDVRNVVTTALPGHAGLPRVSPVPGPVAADVGAAPSASDHGASIALDHHLRVAR